MSTNISQFPSDTGDIIVKKSHLACRQSVQSNIGEKKKNHNRLNKRHDSGIVGTYRMKTIGEETIRKLSQRT